MRPCYTFTAKAPTEPTVLALDEDIGFWGTQAKDFRASLEAVASDKLEVQINSPGGDVVAGLAMYNMLRTWASTKGREVTVRVMALAGSIASVIALAGDKRVMPANSFAMMHGASGGVFGTEDDVREYADVMAKVNGTIRNLYVERMGITAEKAAELTAKDHWLTAQECLELGFATEISDPVTATAKFDLARADLPANVAAVFSAQADAAAAEKAAAEKAEAERLAAEKAEAERLAAEKAEADRLAAEKAEAERLAASSPVAEQIMAKAKTFGLEAHASVFALRHETLDGALKQMGEAREIVALCRVAGKDALSAKAIREGTSPADVRKQLLTALASEDEHIDTEPTSKTNGAPANPTVVNPTALWDSHNKLTKKGR